MTSIDFGDQILSLDFANPATAKSFNRSFHKLMPSGIYQGLTIDISSNTEIQVNPGIMYITNKTLALPLSLRIELTTADTLTVSNANKYVIARFDWQDLANWYAQITTVSYADILSTDIIIGTLVYSGSNLIAIDYTRKSNNIITDLTSRKNNLKVLPSTTPDANVTVTSGTAYINGNYVNYAGGTLAMSSVTSGMITLITLDSSGTIAKVDSFDTGSPTQPDFPVGKLVLAIITRIGTTSIVTGDQITNLVIDKTYGSQALQSDTIIIASSNSDTLIQQNANLIVSSSADINSVINPYITSLSSGNGGTIKVLAGTYLYTTALHIKSNVKIIGEGEGSTIFKLNTSSLATSIFIDNGAKNYGLENFCLHGNLSSYTYTGTVQVILNNSLVEQQGSISNIRITDFKATASVEGFVTCYNLTNCIVSNCHSNGGVGLIISPYYICKNLKSCKIENIVTNYQVKIYGFYNCTNVIFPEVSTISSSNSSSIVNFLNLCFMVSNVYLISTLNLGSASYDFILSCTNLNNILITSITTNNASACAIFKSCHTITNCQAQLNDNTGSGAVSGFSQCYHMTCNRSISNKTNQYLNCNADYANSVAVADTAAGGWNG